MSFTLKEIDRLTRTMCWYTVLLEYISVTSNGMNGQQHLLHQYDVAIITAINFSVTIDENEACVSWQIQGISFCVSTCNFAQSDLSSYIQCFSRYCSSSV